VLLCIFYRHLAGEIAGEWTDMSGDDDKLRAKLVGLACQIVPYNMAHNAEAEACDLLMEIERLDLLEQYVDESAYPRVCLYLTRQVIYFEHFIFFKSDRLALLWKIKVFWNVTLCHWASSCRSLKVW
jgi:hypothetical protein